MASASQDMANQVPQNANGMSLVFWPNIAVGLSDDDCSPDVIFKPGGVHDGFSGQYAVKETVKTGGVCRMTFTVDASLKWRGYQRSAADGTWELVQGNGTQAAGVPLQLTVSDREPNAVLLIEATGFPQGAPTGQVTENGVIVNKLPAPVTSFFSRA
ncbi:hypothetical protein [Streptomyces sp900105755]|uniref:Uncharacterized protein n=2 Tax=unclassified Streptomyces TaxID=2593676 RepID=A0ABV1TWZ3_9ACTN